MARCYAVVLLAASLLVAYFPWSDEIGYTLATLLLAYQWRKGNPPATGVA